jgi:hypothetical protein
VGLAGPDFGEFEPIQKLGLWPDVTEPLLPQFGAVRGVLDGAAVQAFTQGGSLALALVLQEHLGGTLRLCLWSKPPRIGRLEGWLRSQHVVLESGDRWWDVLGARRPRSFRPGRFRPFFLDTARLHRRRVLDGLPYVAVPELEGEHVLNSGAGLILGDTWMEEARSMVPEILLANQEWAQRSFARRSHPGRRADDAALS